MSTVSVDIQEAFNPLIEALGYPVQWPNTDFKPTGAYLSVKNLPSRSEVDSFGSDRLPFTLQIDVAVKDGIGAIIPATMVDTVKSAFSKGKIITQNTTRITIDREPYDSPPLQKDGWYFTPVSIPFEVYV